MEGLQLLGLIDGLGSSRRFRVYQGPLIVLCGRIRLWGLGPRGCREVWFGDAGFQRVEGKTLQG